MINLTRRSILRSSLGIAAAGALGHPFIANAQAKTATVWWAQGFAQEEDVAFKKLVADYQKTSGNTIDYTIIPFAPMRQKIVSAVTSGVVPDLFTNNPVEILALYAWEGKLVDVTDTAQTRSSSSDWPNISHGQQPEPGVRFPSRLPCARTRTRRPACVLSPRHWL